MPAGLVRVRKEKQGGTGGGCDLRAYGSAYLADAISLPPTQCPSHAPHQSSPRAGHEAQTHPRLFIFSERHYAAYHSLIGASVSRQADSKTGLTRNIIVFAKCTAPPTPPEEEGDCEK